MPLDLNALARFAAVLEHGGFSPAARALGLPRQSVHRSVLKLEAQSGVRLLERSTRHVRPTDAGRRLFEHAVAILRQADEAQATLSARAEEPSGRLRLTSTHLIAEALLTDVLSTYLARWPRVALATDFTVSVTDLLRDDIDLAIRAGSDPPPSMLARRLATMDFVCCAAPAYLARSEPIAHPRALGQHPTLAYGAVQRTARWAFERGGESMTLQVEPRLSTDNAVVARQACVAGLGILRIPRFGVQPLLDRGALVEVLGGWKQPEIPLWAIYPSRADRNPALGALLDLLRERLPTSV